MAFIVLDGPDGGGKSTQAKLLAEALAAEGRPVCLTRDPGGTPLGEGIRRLLLDPAEGPLAADAELLLYLASRAQLVAEVLRPALARGATVIADRFSPATLVYQGLAAGRELAQLRPLAALAAGGLEPDVTVILDLPAAAGLARRPGRDRMEARGEDFHRRVREGFLALAAAGGARYRVVDASPPPAAVARAVRQAVAHVL